MMRIHIFHTGSVIVDQSIPYKEKNPLAPLGWFRGKDKKTELAVSAYLIEHPKGNILIDTGWSSRYITEPPKRFFGLLNGISTPVIHKGESIDKKLEALGMTAADLSYIVFSHMDFDHTSGLELLKGAKHVMASAEEYADSKRYFFRYVKSNWSFAKIEPFVFQKTGIGPVGKSYDLFGDGSVVFVNTPGHTHGLVTTLVQSGGKYAAIAGDTFYTQKNLREHIIPGFTVDRALAEKSLDYMLALAADPNCIGLFANHDPEVKEQVISL
ncbi:MAG: N-acyl homoserine lactonase family protein [Oscillospiraceae bacterium]|jgi:N-acyl homoserine lactone hydrolase|nr:N-acyl homoserine lactonase family protein [Oscillospiraceae bacterium]MDD3260385.1 N-acyl homoserine lactonase family protein [Oscillospiraceae bacterium]